MFDYDLFVIGAGSGGVRAARMAAQRGMRVGIAEKRFLGGTCVNVGCVPKKLFYYGSHFHADFEDSAGYGWDAGRPSFDWNTLRDNKTAEIERLNAVYAGLLERAGVDLLRGHARIAGPNEVSVEGSQIRAAKILVATGARPHIPAFPGSDLAVGSDDIFYLDALPANALVVGGGYIALEFAGILHGLGVDVTLSYRGTQLLRHFDHALGANLLEEMRGQGINVLLQSDVLELRKNAAQVDATFADGSQGRYGLVLYATGRAPCTDDMGLENTAVQVRDNGQLVVDEYFQTAEPTVYALGDIIGTPELTPVAIAQAMAFVDTWFGDTRRTVDYEALATAVFSQPNIGSAGLSEEVAQARGIDCEIYETRFRHMKHTLSGRQERTFMKLVVERSTDRVLGAHMLGQDAGEIIQGIAIAMKAGATKAVFDATIGIHPTAAEEFVTMREARSPSPG